MNELVFGTCDHLFSHECNGEVVNLVRAAERYGILVEKAKARIEAVCLKCRKLSMPEEVLVK